MQTYPGAPAPASTDRSKTLLWIGLGLIVGGVLVQLAFNFILSLGDFRLYRAVGWLNFITVLTPIGTVIAVIGGAGVGTRMALREAGLLPDATSGAAVRAPGAPPAGPYGQQGGGHPGEGPYPSA